MLDLAASILASLTAYIQTSKPPGMHNMQTVNGLLQKEESPKITDRHH